MIPSPEVSVVIGTRNRGDSVVQAVRSVLAISQLPYELILVDQSTNQETNKAIQPFLPDPRFRYIPSDTVGAGRARNIGIANARAAFVACTDDDCTVSPNWLEVIRACFLQNERVGMVFTNVYPAQHDPTREFIPSYCIQKDNLVRNTWEKRTARGIGASMAIRKAGVEIFGGFDNLMGPGAKFPGCEEGDLATRVLLRGWWVYETCQTGVIHYGIRSFEEGKQLAKRDWVGIGAAYAKPLKCGHSKVLPVILHEAFSIALFSAVKQLLNLKKPSGLKKFYYFWLGFIKGFQTPVSREKILYQER